MSDVLTAKHIKRARDEMSAKPPRRPVFYGPPWAKAHLAEHDFGRSGCADCLRAWSAIQRW